MPAHSAGGKVRCSSNLRLQPYEDGTLSLRLASTSSTSSHEVAVYQHSEALSPHANYFEVQILTAGSDARICIGLAHAEHALHRHPGSAWGSVGYRTNDGALLSLSKSHQFGAPSGVLDRVGCGLLFPKSDEQEMGVRVFYTRNGERMGRAAVLLSQPVGGLFPTLGVQAGSGVASELLLFRPEALGQEEEDEGGRRMEEGEEEEEDKGPWAALVGLVKRPGNELHFQHELEMRQQRQVALAIARSPLTRRRPFFELTLLEMGTDAAVAVGLCGGDMGRSQMPGWAGDTLGFHSDDGMLYVGRAGRRHCLGPPCSQGERIGVGVFFPRTAQEREDEEVETDVKEEVRAFFTRNGRIVGSHSLALSLEAVYPCIGVMNESGAVTRVRFEFSPLSG